MNRPARDVSALARMLLQNERADGAATPMAAAERVLQGLAERLSPLVGVGGFQLLLQRALKRARAGHPALAAIQPDATVPWRLAGAAEGSRAEAGDEAAAEAILAETIALITRFLGADMAIRLVLQDFPEATRDGTGSGSEETTHA
jgi:hypothetical protein